MEGWYVRTLLLSSNEIRSNILTMSTLDKNSRDSYYFGNSKEFYDYSSYDKESGDSSEYDDFIDRVAIVHEDLEDDSYLDLLELENKIVELKNKKLLTNMETKILNLVLEGRTYSEISEILNKSRLTIIINFKRLCGKIAFYLGDYFTNEGYISYIAKKYNLDDVSINKMRSFIYND